MNVTFCAIVFYFVSLPLQFRLFFVIIADDSYEKGKLLDNKSVWKLIFWSKAASSPQRKEYHKTFQDLVANLMNSKMFTCLQSCCFIALDIINLVKINNLSLLYIDSSSWERFNGCHNKRQVASLAFTFQATFHKDNPKAMHYSLTIIYNKQNT